MQEPSQACIIGGELRELDSTAIEPRVLFVEDDPELSAIIQRLLKKHGYGVDVAHSHQEFRALVNHESYQVVLVDHGLPDGSGLDIIQRYARTDAEPAFIMLSGQQETSLAVAAMRAGALDYLTKDGDRAFLELLPVVLGNVIERVHIRSKERKLQTEMLDADRKLSAALRASPVPTMLFDASGAIHQVNRAWRESIAIRSAHGFTLESLLFATFEDAESVKSALDEAYDGPVEHTVRIRTMRGAGRTWRLTIAPLPVSEGDPALARVFVCLGLDITDSIELERQLRTLSLEDPLTGLPNRRSLQERLPAELARAHRESSVVSVAMIDIDHFKAFNDFYGHLAGDTCLARVAESIRSTLRRPTDYVARFGGEEFAVVLPGANVDGARKLLQAVRASVERLAIPNENSPGEKTVTVSVGYACSATMDGSGSEEMLNAADVALFAAKDRGRNRVERHPV